LALNGSLKRSRKTPTANRLDFGLLLLTILAFLRLSPPSSPCKMVRKVRKGDGGKAGALLRAIHRMRERTSSSRRSETEDETDQEDLLLQHRQQQEQHHHRRKRHHHHHQPHRKRNEVDHLYSLDVTQFQKLTEIEEHQEAAVLAEEPPDGALSLVPSAVSLSSFSCSSDSSSIGASSGTPSVAGAREIDLWKEIFNDLTCRCFGPQ